MAEILKKWEAGKKLRITVQRKLLTSREVGTFKKRDVKRSLKGEEIGAERRAREVQTRQRAMKTFGRAQPRLKRLRQ